MCSGGHATKPQTQPGQLFSPGEYIACEVDRDQAISLTYLLRACGCEMAGTSPPETCGWMDRARRMECVTVDGCDCLLGVYSSSDGKALEGPAASFLMMMAGRGIGSLQVSAT